MKTNLRDLQIIPKINLFKVPLLVLMMILASVLMDGQSAAQSISYDHNVTADCSWWKDNGVNSPPTLETDSDSHRSTSAGTSVKDLNVRGTLSTFVESTMFVDNAGQIRSFNTITSDSPFAGESGFHSLTVNSSNLITVTDKNFCHGIS